MLVTSPATSSSDDTNEDLSNYVLSLDDDLKLTGYSVKKRSESLNKRIRHFETTKHDNLLKLLENSVAFEGVKTFDTAQIQSLLHVELVNSWSMPLISLTCIALAIPNIHNDTVDNLIKSVDEGLSYTHLVEANLNREPEYLNIRRTTIALWDEVEKNRKWLDTTLKSSAYEGKSPTEIIKSFSHIAEEILNNFNINTNGAQVEKGSLSGKVIAANSMYRIAQTIMHTYQSSNLEITGDALFTRLSHMIADILAACLTNIPQIVRRKCQENAIEKREVKIVAAINLLGQTTEILERLEKHELPAMDPDKMGFIDEWRLHLMQP